MFLEHSLRLEQFDSFKAVIHENRDPHAGECFADADVPAPTLGRSSAGANLAEPHSSVLNAPQTNTQFRSLTLSPRHAAFVVSEAIGRLNAPCSAHEIVPPRPTRLEVGIDGQYARQEIFGYRLRAIHITCPYSASNF